MQNLNPKGSRTRRQVRLTTLAFVIAAFGVFAATISVILTTIPVVNTQSSAYGLYTLGVIAILLFGVLLIVVGIGVAARALTLRPENDLARVAGDWLSHQLDARYAFIRNYNRPGVGYIDGILVGPPGALVLRILDTKGDLLNDGVNWVKRNRTGGYDVIRIDPTREAITDIRKLRDHLSKHHLGDVPVYGVVVFNQSDRDLRITAQQPTVPPTHLHRLLETLRADYFAAERIDAARVKVVVSLLMD